jgi:hypothetical protein
VSAGVRIPCAAYACAIKERGAWTGILLMSPSLIVKYRHGLLPGDKDTIPRKELQLYEKIEISLTVALADAYQINSHPPINYPVKHSEEVYNDMLCNNTLRVAA